jgi:endonuclease/exonuclease/phosphatase (EEP) superfamily protein YafD
MRFARGISGLAAAGAIAITGFTFAARLVPIHDHILLISAALSPYLMLASLVVAPLLLRCRRWLLATVTIVIALAAVATQLPVFIPRNHASGHATVRVLTANLYLSQADPAAVAATARDRADVVAFEELTPQAVRAFAAAGLDRDFPYRGLDARAYASGVGLYSRFPIVDSRPIYHYALAMVTARVHVPGVAMNPTILVAHVAGPWPQPTDVWNDDLTRMPTTLREAASGGGCVIAAGDFNSTRDMWQFRNLLRQGYQDAAEQAGAGITATYPANIALPPMIAIDHVLTRRCVATSADTVTLPGSDHRGLVATVEVTG